MMTIGKTHTIKTQTTTSIGTTTALKENHITINVANVTVTKRKNKDQKEDVVVSTFLDGAKLS